MDRLFLRKESPPDDAVVVIRGGNMMLESLRKSAEASFHETGLYLLSVFLVEEQKLEDVCARPEENLFKLINCFSQSIRNPAYV